MCQVIIFKILGCGGSYVQILVLAVKIIPVIPCRQMPFFRSIDWQRKNSEAVRRSQVKPFKKFNNMVHTVLTSNIHSASNTHSRRRNHMFSQTIYEVTVNGEDGEYRTYEIMADDSASACSLAENLAISDMIDISYIEIKIMG